MAKIKGGGIRVDTNVLKWELRRIAVYTKGQTAKIAKELLQEQINAIQDSSAMRLKTLNDAGISVSSGTQDQALGGAYVSVRHHGQSVTVRVVHKSKTGVNVFNILDAGTPDRTVETGFVFPVYEGHTTGPDFGTTKILKDASGKPVLTAKRPGSTLKGIKARNFYKQVALLVEQEIVNGRIVNPSRRSKYRLKLKDVNIKVI